MKLWQKIEKHLPQANPDITDLYSKVIADHANSIANPIIVDVGGGRTTPFVKLLKNRKKIKLIVLDHDKNEMKYNLDADKKMIMTGEFIPLKKNSADLIVSRYTLEHMQNLNDFINSSYGVLKKGGLSIHLFSCKFAPFSLINQLLPNCLTKFLLKSFVPGSKNIRGFKIHYDQCYYSAILSVFKSQGFKINKVTLSYYSSRYYSFFLPLYLISSCFEFLIYFLNIQNLSSYILIEVKK